MSFSIDKSALNDVSFGIEYDFIRTPLDLKDSSIHPGELQSHEHPQTPATQMLGIRYMLKAQ